MNIKGTQTEKNIEAALLGESLARNKYTFFASQARMEGHEDLAKLFERMAINECTHAKVWFSQLHDGLGSSMKNLEDSARGEYGEWSSMYPEFARVAREEGLEEVAVRFEKVAAIEKIHEKTFMEAMAALVKSNGGTAPAHEEEKQEVIQGWRCQFCGAVYEEKPVSCGLCGAMDAFETCQITK